MERRIERSLPWRHRPFPELVRLAWPIAVSTLSYSVMTLVGTLFVARLGASALAGVGLGGVASFMVLCFGFGALRAVNVLVAQAVGAGDRPRARRWLWAGIWTALVLGVVMLVAGQLLASVLHHLAASEAAGHHAQVYVSVRLLSAPALMLFVALREHRYGLGETRTPMLASLLGNVANITFDWLFIVQLHWGVVGAAWATVIGHGLEAGLLIVLAARDRLWPVRVRWAELRQLLEIGAPTGAQFWMEVGSFGLLTTIIASLGDVQLAAHQIALQVVHFAVLPAMALGEAGAVLAGQAVGAGEVRLVRRVARLAVLGAVAYNAACTLVVVIGGQLITSAFTSDGALSRVTVSLLWMSSAFLVADGAAVVARGVLRGTGDVRFPAVVGIACAWMCTPPLTWLLGRWLGLGALGGWIGLSLEIALAAGILWWRLERAGWLASARRSHARLRADRLALAPA